MTKMFTSGFKPRSTTKAAKQIIRKEMLSYFSARNYGVKSNLDAIHHQAEATCRDDYRYRGASDWNKCKELVNSGFFACYYHDQMKMLSKIYGKQVESWSGNKIHETYSNLIGREYAAMLREQKTRNAKKR